MHRTDRRLWPSRMLKRPRRLATTVALAIGIAAVPTVALAVTTDALPGDPFKLGQENKIANATTTLAGNPAASTDGVLQVRRDSGSFGPALKVENAVTGGIGTRGIDIRVPKNQAPINVNPDAGKSNLNVDRLDGRDEEDFLPTRLYGNGTTSLIQGQGGGKSVLITALSGLECDEGDIALNAGFRAQDPASDIAGDDASDLVAMEPFRSSYTIELRDNGFPSQFRANIICMDNARPFR